MTLKIRSRSPKSIHFFSHPNDVSVLVWFKFKPLVKEIVCTQALYCIKEFLQRAITLKSNNVCAEIDEYPSLHFQDIKKIPKVSWTDGRTLDGWMDGHVKTVYPTTNKFAGGITVGLGPFHVGFIYDNCTSRCSNLKYVEDKNSVCVSQNQYICCKAFLNTAYISMDKVFPPCK